ncbi:MAG: hypothetical protein LBI95_02020 [Holosporales bacterium]|nr:hypothetical protein [Holosporales bacterium]
MCQSCDDRVAEWMESETEEHPKMLLVLSTQMCNRPLATSVDCIAYLTEKSKSALQSGLSLPCVIARGANEIKPRLSKLDGIKCSVSQPHDEKMDYWWSVRCPYHPARLQLTTSKLEDREEAASKMIPGLIRIRLPDLTFRCANEYKSPDKLLKNEELLKNPVEEQVRTDKNFGNAERNPPYKLSEFFPERARIVKATLEELRRLFHEVKSYKTGLSEYKKPVKQKLLEKVLENFYSANSGLGVLRPDMKQWKEDDYKNVQLLSYILKLLDVYSDVCQDMRN